MQTYDLVDGSLAQSVRSFVKDNPNLLAKFESQLTDVSLNDCLKSIDHAGPAYYKKWKGLGGMVLFEEDIPVIISALRSLNSTNLDS